MLSKRTIINTASFIACTLACGAFNVASAGTITTDKEVSANTGISIGGWQEPSKEEPSDREELKCDTLRATGRCDLADLDKDGHVGQSDVDLVLAAFGGAAVEGADTPKVCYDSFGKESYQSDGIVNLEDILQVVACIEEAPLPPADPGDSDDGKSIDDTRVQDLEDALSLTRAQLDAAKLKIKSQRIKIKELIRSAADR